MGIATNSVEQGAALATGSPLLEKARRLGLLRVLDLERLAIARGCNYYERNLGQPALPDDAVPLSNAELAIALIVPAQQPKARQVRLAAALLGAADEPAVKIASVAMEENVAGIVRYIASCGSRFESQNGFWTALLNALPEVAVNRDDLPHPTRFVEMTGIDRGKVGIFTRWIRAHSRSTA
jgi:hypothetical protein